MNIVWFPSDAPEADDRPFILLLAGGGFVNVWNISEGWPIADQYNRYGFHVFILTYQVDGERGLLARALEKLKIPCRLEIGPTGGHGFADGTGMSMAGWTERAAKWAAVLG